MRINLLIGPFLPFPPYEGGGVEQVWYGLAKEFARQGHTVTVVSKQTAYPQVADGIHHIKVASVGRRRWAAANMLIDVWYSIRALRKFPPGDILVTNTFFSPILAGRSLGLIYVHVARRPRRQFELYTRAARFQAVSKAVAEEMNRQNPKIRSRTRVIPNPLPGASVAAPAEGARAHEVLFVGRIAPEKGLVALVEALASSHQELTPTLRLVGPCDAASGGGGDSFLAELVALAKQKKVPVAYEGPIYDRRALRAAYSRAKVFAYPSLPSSGESFGLSPLEAMAVGTPVVVTNLPCFLEYLVPDVNGLSVDGSGRLIEELRSQIDRLFCDDALWHRLSGNGPATASSFSAHHIATKFIEDFECLLGSEATR